MKENEDTSKFIFSLMNMALEVLFAHLLKYDTEEEEFHSLQLVQVLLDRVYLEMSHIEEDFGEDYMSNS